VTATLVDSNIILDVIKRDPIWLGWSIGQLAGCGDAGKLLVNPTIYAEVSAGFQVERDVISVLKSFGIELADMPWDGAFEAGRTHWRYRKSQGGPREKTLPDFMIGAHAAVQALRILTRDASRFRTYFPNVDIIAPDTHP
jgi:predicted nucleic acid-binding protein